MKDLPFFIIIGIEKCSFSSTKTTCDVTWQLKDIKIYNFFSKNPLYEQDKNVWFALLLVQYRHSPLPLSNNLLENREHCTWCKFVWHMDQYIITSYVPINLKLWHSFPPPPSPPPPPPLPPGHLNFWRLVCLYPLGKNFIQMLYQITRFDGQSFGKR